MKTIAHNGTDYACPFSERFRRHTKDERLLMMESIRTNGIQQPVVLYRDTDLDSDNCVLDGEGRLTLAAGFVGCNVPFRHVGNLSTDQAFQLARVFNDHRRQDDPEEVRKRRSERIERVAKARSAGKTLEMIAKEEGVGVSQVQRDLDKAGSVLPGGKTENEKPAKVKGKDGKTYAAKKKKNTPEPVSQPAEPDDKQATGEQTVPETTAERLRRESIENVKAISGLCYELDAMAEKVATLGDRPGCWAVHWQSCRDSIKAARSGLWAGRPNHACPYCKATGERDGKECTGCRGLGWVRKGQAESGKRAVGDA